MTVRELIALCRTKLHDQTGAIWSDAELLQWVQDGYHEFLIQSQAVRRIVALDSPGRHTYAITFDWEDRYAQGGTVRKLSKTMLAGTLQGTQTWEVETAVGIAGTVTSVSGYTHEWERGLAESDQPFMFTFPHDHERIVRMDWQNRRLSPVSVRELDDPYVQWMSQAGLPRYWTTGLGRTRSVDVFAVDPTYHLAYHLVDAEQGMARSFTGERTWSTSSTDIADNVWAFFTDQDAEYVPAHGVRVTTSTTAGYETAFGDVYTFSWESPFVLPYGLVRSVSSAARQYLASTEDGEAPYGLVRAWHSSEDTILAIEVVCPSRDLQMDDTPGLVPQPLLKYVRFYVLSAAFARPGEGRQPILATHYSRRFQRGVEVFRRFGDLTHKDRLWQRDDGGVTDRREPYVHLPGQYPRVTA
jgi:hypothetical protein